MRMLLNSLLRFAESNPIQEKSSEKAKFSRADAQSLPVKYFEHFELYFNAAGGRVGRIPAC